MLVVMNKWGSSLIAMGSRKPVYCQDGFCFGEARHAIPGWWTSKARSWASSGSASATVPRSRPGRKTKKRRPTTSLATKAPISETRIGFTGVGFDVYERLIRATRARTAVRMAYDGKDLEIMVKGPVHDHYGRLLDRLITAVAVVLGIRRQARGRDDVDSPGDRARA